MHANMLGLSTLFMTWVLSFRRRRLAEHRARLPAAFRPKTVSSGRTAAKIDRPLVLLSLQPPDRGSGTMEAGRDLRANGREMIGGGRDWLAGGHQRVALGLCAMDKGLHSTDDARPSIDDGLHPLIRDHDTT